MSGRAGTWEHIFQPAGPGRRPASCGVRGRRQLGDASLSMRVPAVRSRMATRACSPPACGRWKAASRPATPSRSWGRRGGWGQTGWAPSHHTFLRSSRRRTVTLKVPDNQTIVIFGATGDLTGRKLLPALYNLFVQSLLPEDFAVVGYSRTEMSVDEVREHQAANVAKYSRTGLDPHAWA